LSSAGDWRLPNIKELLSLLDYRYYDPALPSTHPFSGVQSTSYWTSTTFSYSTDYAWYVLMNNGISNYQLKTRTNYVWPVRGGN